MGTGRERQTRPEGSIGRRKMVWQVLRKVGSRTGRMGLEGKMEGECEG